MSWSVSLCFLSQLQTVSDQGSTVQEKPTSQFHQTLGKQLVSPCHQVVTEPVGCGGNNSPSCSISEASSAPQETHSSSPPDKRTESQAGSLADDGGSSSPGNTSQHTLHSSIVRVNCLASVHNAPCDGGNQRHSTDPRPSSPAVLVVPPVHREPAGGDTGSLHVAPLARPVPESFRRKNTHKLLLRTSSYTGKQDDLEDAIQVSDACPVEMFCLLVYGRVFRFHCSVPQAEGDPLPVGCPLSPRPQAQLLPCPTPFLSVPSSETEALGCPLANLHINGSGCFNTLTGFPGIGTTISQNEQPTNGKLPFSFQYKRKLYLEVI